MRGMWRKGACMVALVSATSLAAPSAGAAQDAADAEVLAVVTTLFDGMREKDEAKIRSVFHADARLHTAGPTVTGMPIENFIQNVIGSQAELDEVTFDEDVLVDGPLAVAWTPYNLFVNGQFSHCGVDAFTMVRADGGWKILQIVDTRETEGCDPSRRG